MTDVVNVEHRFAEVTQCASEESAGARALVLANNERSTLAERIDVALRYSSGSRWAIASSRSSSSARTPP